MKDPARTHVVICTDGVFPQALGGMQRHTRLLAEHLARSGSVDLTVIHPHAEQVFDDRYGIREVRIAPIDTERNYLLELWRYSGRVAEALDALDADVILSQGFCVWKGIGRFRDRSIMHPHGLEMFQGITTKERLIGVPYRAVLRYMARRSAVVISLGGRLTGILRALVRGSGAEVVVLPNAVDVPAEVVPYHSGSTPLRMLFVGRFAFNKGLDVLVEVARRLVREGKTDLFRFELVGDGPLLAGMHAAGVPANVVLLGRVDDETLFRKYGECDAFVLPTRFEGMPTVVLEAMARSRPIIVSDVGASAELVDATNGHLIPKGDPDALYEALIAFASATAEERGTMANASYLRARQHFSWPAVTQGFLEVFARMQAGRTQRE